MTRRTKPIIGWTHPPWNSRVVRALEKRIESARDAIAQSLRVEEPAEIDALIEDICTELASFMLVLDNVDRAGSTAEVHATLTFLASQGDLDETDYWGVDPATRIAIDQHYPDGTLATEGELDPQALRRAVRGALAKQPAPRRGRPPGSKKFAMHALARGLAMVYQTHTGLQPGRRVLRDDSHTEYGQFFDFVAMVLNRLPSGLRKTGKGAIPGPAYFVRLGDEYASGIRSWPP